jgi:pimeloyl-ACP methyl ester carboxylesterase
MGHGGGTLSRSNFSGIAGGQRSPVRFGIIAALLVGALVLAAAALTAGARKADGSPSTAIPERYVAINGARGAGPERFDRVFVNEIGPPGASRVLVLVPGYIGGAGDFRLIGREIVARVPDLQVWAVDRRSNALEDTSVFATGEPDKAFAYYLNFQSVDGRRFQPLNGQDFPYARQWGLDLALRDLRGVILAARAEGARRVILGGHSLGASTAVAYATWDFDGRPGYKDIDGLVLIDGGLKGTFASPTFEQVKQRLQELQTGDPFVDLVGLGLPWAAGVFAEDAALYALKKPNEPSVLQQYPPIPPEFKAPVRTTNEAALGYAFDASTSPPGFELIRVRAGQLAPSGDPRPWQDGEVTPIQRLAQTFATEPGNGIEWYFPKRLTLDVDGTDQLERNQITDFLGLRPWHTAKLKLPLYAFETDLTGGAVLRGARRLIDASKIKRATLIADHEMSHLDPLTAAPDRNTFLQTILPFLSDVLAKRGGHPQRAHKNVTAAREWAPK